MSKIFIQQKALVSYLISFGQMQYYGKTNKANLCSYLGPNRLTLQMHSYQVTVSRRLFCQVYYTETDVTLPILPSLLYRNRCQHAYSAKSTTQKKMSKCLFCQVYYTETDVNMPILPSLQYRNRCQHAYSAKSTIQKQMSTCLFCQVYNTETDVNMPILPSLLHRKRCQHLPTSKVSLSNDSDNMLWLRY